MSDDMERVLAKIDKVADLAQRGAQQAERNTGLLGSLQNQTKEQWDKIEAISRSMERTVTTLERTVQDQARLEKRLERQIDAVHGHDRTISKAQGGLLAFKWIAGASGILAALAAIKSFFGFPST